jgi:anti-anti-sigma regulatory factor
VKKKKPPQPMPPQPMPPQPTLEQPPQEQAPQVVELAERMSIAQSAELQRTLTVCLASGAPLLIKGDRVEQIDTSVLQLLVSAWLGAAKRGIECRWQSTSQALCRSALLIGAAEILQLNGSEGGSEI